MNIFEAIELKKDLQTRIDDLGKRYVFCSTVKKGEKPIENPQELQTELEDNLSQLNDICCRINAANNTSRNSQGQTLVQLLAEKAIVEKRLEILRRTFSEIIFGDADFYNYCNKPACDYDATIDIKSTKEQIDHQEARLRELNSEIQTLDLTTEI